MTTLDELRKDPTAEYLRDAVYASHRADGTLVLCTSNGIAVTNEIVMELETLHALSKYMDRQRQRLERALKASPTDGDYTP